MAGRSERIYGALLWLLPGPFRREYGEAMRQTFADLRAARGPAVWVRAVPDLVCGAAREWAAAVRPAAVRPATWARCAGVLTAALVFAAGIWAAVGTGSPAATFRASLTAGVLAGVMLLLVNVANGLLTMAALRRNPQYLGEFVHSGQRDVAAYIVGERISGGRYGIVFGLVAGAVFGALSLPASRMRPHA
jgi:hypothetical protein